MHYSRYSYAKDKEFFLQSKILFGFKLPTDQNKAVLIKWANKQMVRVSPFAAAQDITGCYVLFEEDRQNGYVDDVTWKTTNYLRHWQLPWWILIMSIFETDKAEVD